MSGKRNLLAIPLVLLGTGAIGALDFMQFSKTASSQGTPATVGVWMASVTTRLQTGVIDMADMMAADLTDPLPRARGEWTVAAYADADGEALTGLATPTAPVDDLSPAALLATLAAASHAPGTEAVTYRGPDGQSVIMLVNLAVPGQPVPGLYAPALEELALLLPPGGGVFAGSGISIYPAPADSLVPPVRQFIAYPGTDISLHILTNAGDADLTALLEDTNHAGFIALQPPEGLDRTTAAFAALSLPVPGTPEARPRQATIGELMGGGGEAAEPDVAAAAPAPTEPAATQTDAPRLAAGECTTIGAMRRCTVAASD